MDSLEFKFIELPKFRKNFKNQKVINSKLDAWLALIDYSDMELVEMAKRKFKTIEEAIEAYEALYADPELIHYLDMRQIAKMDAISRENWIRRDLEEKNKRSLKKAIGKATRHGHNQGFIQGHKKGIAQGHAEGHEIGRAEGRAEGITEGSRNSQTLIAKNMLKEGLDISFISKMTNLSEEEIKNLL